MKLFFKYAQIDETGRCVGISYLSGEVASDDMILLSESDIVNLRDTYNDGVWTLAPPPDPAEPQPTPEQIKIAQLESENAELKTRVSDIEMFVADMIGGV